MEKFLQYPQIKSLIEYFKINNLDLEFSIINRRISATLYRTNGEIFNKFSYEDMNDAQLDDNVYFSSFLIDIPKYLLSNVVATQPITAELFQSIFPKKNTQQNFVNILLEKLVNNIDIEVYTQRYGNFRRLIQYYIINANNYNRYCKPKIITQVHDDKYNKLQHLNIKMDLVMKYILNRIKYTPLIEYNEFKITTNLFKKMDKIRYINSNKYLEYEHNYVIKVLDTLLQISDTYPTVISVFDAKDLQDYFKIITEDEFLKYFIDNLVDMLLNDTENDYKEYLDEIYKEYLSYSFQRILQVFSDEYNRYLGSLYYDEKYVFGVEYSDEDVDIISEYLYKIDDKDDFILHQIRDFIDSSDEYYGDEYLYERYINMMVDTLQASIYSNDPEISPLNMDYVQIFIDNYFEGF